ncbi:unnamed protein product [Lathyrus sativus]|nr:unnamed protein product [Lathyrus sativus]
MTSTLANMSFSAPTSSCRMNKISNLKLTTLSGTRNTTFYNNVKAMATGDDSSLQRAKLPPKMKLSQASPSVLLNQFPVARALQQRMETMDGIVEDPLVGNDGSRRIVLDNECSRSIVLENNEHARRKNPWLIKEGQYDYKVRFNMPGMNKNDVKVWIEEKVLVVKAEKIATEQHEGQPNGSGEFSEEHEDWPANIYGRYNHRISLPDNVEFEKIEAQVKNGVLYIRIPKAKSNAKVIGIDVQ